MKPVASDHGPALGRLPRRWPIATASVLAVTVVVTVLQLPFPAVRLALWRDPDALAAGQWWRLVTALFVQYDPWWQIVIVFALIAGVGVVAERLFGPGRWLLLYLGCGVVGQAFGFRWQPYDAGASVAGAGLLGAVCAWLLSPAGPPLARVRIWGLAWPLAGLVLTAVGDLHGPPLLLGFALGALLLWRDRRRHPGPGERRRGAPRAARRRRRRGRARGPGRGARGEDRYRSSPATRLMVVARMTAPSTYDSSAWRSAAARNAEVWSVVSDTWKVIPTVKAR
jgi:rhomboid protease GluP